MLSKAERHCVPVYLHDAPVKGVRLEGLDVAVRVGLPVETRGNHAQKTPHVKARRLVSLPCELVFWSFNGQAPWALQGHTLELPQEKDGAYLLGTDTFEGHVVRARKLCLRIPASAENGNPLLPEEVRP